ncbi:unnamed protein product [Rotaria sp. Silwood1]|nr:unnamed protein product [Rotaria sp. Silwood1]
MGSTNSVNITINLDRTNPFYFAGESVSGTVIADIKEEHVKVDEVFLVLKGKVGYTTDPSDFGPYGSRNMDGFFHEVSFFSEKKVLENLGPEKKELIYHSGQHSWKFNIQLPPQLPPTINEPLKYPHVRYYLKLVVDKPWYKRNTNETLNLIVFPCVNLLNNPQCLISSIFGGYNRKDVTLQGNINKLGYVHGEMITGTLLIENPQKILLKETCLSLIQHYQIEHNTGKETIVHTIIPTIVNTQEEHITEKFSLAIPFTHLAPSYQFHGGFPYPTNVNVNYVLEFEVKAQDMSTIVDVSTPIILGTDSDTNAKQHQLNHATNVLPNSLSYYPDTIMCAEHPPATSYSVS